MGKIEGSFNRDGLVTTVVAGAVAGDVAVVGVKLRDSLQAVINDTDGTDLTAEFTITAADTINNVGGTSTAAKVLRVSYQSAN